MEYEKPPTATAFPRKLHGRSHSLSFSGNVIYDGVFASPAVKKSQPLVDYGEIFRGSGPSSSIPFLDVPELKQEKLTVDVRSSKLDYSSVFGGLEGCDFAVSPEELIVKSKKERAGKDEGNPGKAGKPHAARPSKAKNQIAASPEAVGMKQLNMSYNQTSPSIENGMNGITQIAKVHALSGYAKVVNDTCALQKMESRTLVSSVKKEPCNAGPTEFTRPMSSVKLEPCNGAPMEVTRPISSVKMESCNGGPKEVATPVSSVKIETCNGTPAEVKDRNRAGVDVPCSNSASKCSSKTEYEFQNMFGKNGCNIGDISADNACEIDCNAKQPDVMPPSSLQQSSNHNKDASERSMSSKPGASETFDAPCSPPYFDEETDTNSAAAVSAAAVKKAIEEAQLRIKIAKQMMERKKEGRSRVKSRSYDCLKIEDKGNGKDDRDAEGHKEDKGNGKGERETEGHKEDEGNEKDERETEKHGEDKGNGRDGRGTEKHGEDKGNEKEERETEKHRDDKGDWKDESEKEESRDIENQDSGDLVNSLRQVFPKEGDHHLKRARKQWEVPGELLKSNLDHKQEEAEKHDVVKPGEEHARRARKHWEIPGGIFKSVASSMQEDTENIAAAKLDTHPNKDMQPVAESSFYTFGHLGNKIKSVVEAFTGSKVEQKNDAEGADFGVKDSLDDVKLGHEVLIQEDTKTARLVEPKEKFVVPSETEKYRREVGQVLKSTEGTRETQIDNSAEPGMCLLVEECSQKEEKEMGWFGQAKNASELENAPMGNEITGKTPRRRRFWKTSEDVYEMIRFPKGYKRACLLEDDKEEKVKRCLGEDGLRVNDTSNSEATDETSELPSDSGLQENWNVLKQMFRQMFQTVDTGREDETCGQVDTEQMHAEIDQRAEAEDRKGLVESPIYQLTGADKCNDTYSKQNGVRSVGLEFQAHVHTRENEDSKLTLETYHQEEHGTIMGPTEACLVYDLTRKEPEAVEEASNHEEEVGAEVSEASGSVQGAFELDECKEHGDNLAKTLQRDQGEMGSINSVEKCEENPRDEIAEETTIDSSMESDEGEPSFELRQGYSDIEEVELEQKLSDQWLENSSTASSTGENVEEVDSESNKSGFDVEGMELIIEREVHEDNFESYLEEDSADYVEGAGASQPPCELEEDGEIGEESQGSESNEDNSKPECDVECPPEDEFHIRKDAEAAESPSLQSKEEEMDAVLNTNMKEKNKEALCRSPTEEKGEVTADASQKEAEPVQEHLEKTDEAKEKEKEREKERVMVERAIREARERAFAEARGRAERAATEKANAGAQQHRAATTKARVKPEKPSLEVNDKSSLTEKAAMQAKIRAERAAVERALAEARERALEKALSGKAASQARNRGSKPSFSSSGTHTRSTGPFKSYTDTNSSNQSANGEPVQRCKARSERHQRTVERAAKALAEKKLRDIIAQKEQAERNRFADSVAAEVKRWSSGKEGNLRALLSTLQYILVPESGWKSIPLTELVSNAAVRKAYRKATLYVHPDKLQQRGAGTQQKYTCEKVFDLLQEAWNKFSAEER